jgi:hypothetical protein
VCFFSWFAGELTQGVVEVVGCVLIDSTAALIGYVVARFARRLVLADDGEIHPGPTIYDSFWIRDSSVEGVACALVGDSELSVRQFGFHYPRAMNYSGWADSISLSGFIGQEHEINDREWDSNGEALWAIGRTDRILGPGPGFGAGLFGSLILEGARGLRGNRSVFGLLNSGWSAEHIGDKSQPQYSDDFWGLAGLWEAAKLAERIDSPQAQEIWDIFDDLRRSTAESIGWVVTEQHRREQWETFLPTGPGDVGRLDSNHHRRRIVFPSMPALYGQEAG